jgi:hypothetical protein
VLNPNSATNSVLTLKILPEIVALFEKICEEQPILTVFSNIWEDVQNCCFSQMYDVKSGLQPNTMALFGNSYQFYMIETGFPE